MQQLENELAQTQSNLEQATHKLEEKEKALQNVSHFKSFWYSETKQKKHEMALCGINLCGVIHFLFGQGILNSQRCT